MKTALIFGVGGQDGSYLAPFLLDRGYRVVGVHRRSSNDNTGRLTGIKNGCRFSLIEGDLTDSNSVSSIISTVGPDEIYNLAAQSHVHTSFHQPELTFQVNTIGVLHILEAIRHHSPHSRFYQASTSELFGIAYDLDAQGRRIQDERTVFAPCSPYGCAKLAAHELVNVYRTSYRLLCCAGILFNHESPRRGESFVTRKITKYVAALHHCLDEANGRTHRAAKSRFPKLKLGNTKSARDWSHAKDMVRAMWMMLQAETPRDYVVSSNESHTVEDFLDRAFRIIGQDWRDWVETDKDLLRPMEVPHLHGSSRRIREELGWTPNYTFDGLVEEMVTHDIDEFQRGADSSGAPPRPAMQKTHLPAA